ncbi:unnamed protein product [Boreogadus saida]
MRPCGSYGDTEERSRTPRPPSPVGSLRPDEPAAQSQTKHLILKPLSEDWRNARNLPPSKTRRTSRCQLTRDQEDLPCQLIRDGDEGQRASSQQEVRRRTLEGLSECPIREDLQQQSAAGTPSS